MQQRNTRIRVFAATSLVALVALVAASAGSARTHPVPVKPSAVKALAQLRAVQDRDGETWVWIVDGVPQGLPMK